MNHLIIKLLVHMLRNGGVTRAFIGAGSRSTALIQELDHQQFQIHSFLDERAVGFLALGHTKGSQIPSLIVTTSGSAVTNLYPAITEAANSFQSLIVLTADRPKRLQQTSANQTIKQTRIFNNVLSELQLPEEESNNDTFLNELALALRKQQLKGGVIHINCPLEDPVMHPYKPKATSEQQIPSITDQVIKYESFPQSLKDQIQTAQLGVLCIGQTEPFIDSSELITIINRFNWPTIVDATHHQLKVLPNVAQSADDAALALEDQHPDLILYIGGPWVSKKMAQYIETNASKVIHLTQSYKPVAPMPNNSIRIMLNELLNLNNLSSQWLDIESLNKVTHNRLSALPKTSEFSQVKRFLTRLPVTVDCFISNSLPIRYVDQLVLPNVKQLYCNRGASGIDGNIATIAGLCLEETAVPLLAIVGDLAALYDLNAFLLLNSAKRPFTIVILNNGGGCIFEKLPISKTYHKFDDHFKLKHNNQLTPILTGMGLNCENVDSIDLFKMSGSRQILELRLGN